jgi:hypothetical protein
VVPEALLYLKEVRADLAENLRAFFPVVEIEVAVGGAAAGTNDLCRDWR